MSDKKDPAFLFYPADFLIGTMDMTDEEVGIYIRLLCRQHQKGNINPSTKINGQLMSDLSEEILSKFCKDNQGNYYNKRLKTEIDKRKKFTDSRKINGSKGGRPKKHMDKQEESYKKPSGKPTQNHIENENENINIDIIISFLNNILGSKYKRTSKKTRELIKARLSDGFSVEDFKLVIEKKYKEWQGTEFEKFLRPETLFGTKFESYLNQRSKEDVDAGRSKGAKDEGRRDKKDYSTNGRGFKTL
ncbi:MAG: conserved phage C-terminal domain-containing protein [Anaerovoracaceae bacterium]